ncbi:MAG: exosortase-associated EpsI family protein [Sedimentisphaerales bacterium]|nr:exosortase-associated EpsI family protein [Sedimentisphaerales bacterium]
MRNFENIIRIYFQPAFLICVVVLTTAGAGMSIAIKSFGVYLKKEPLPLKKSLDLLDEDDLGPYKIISKQKIENDEIITALGTEDYIQWILRDTEKIDSDNAEKFMLFVTYYQLPDRVPHVPEECYAGGGFQRLASDSVTLEINDNAGFDKKLRGKYLVFGNTKADFWRKGEKFPVLYIFRVNGEYAASREEVRIVLNKNLFNKSSYFCKVELVFNQTLIPPDKEQAIKAGEKLLAVILPVLEAKHWPDWEN